MIQEYINKMDNDFKYIKMYFEELKGAISKVNDPNTDTISLKIAKDKITQCVSKIDFILG